MLATRILISKIMAVGTLVAMLVYSSSVYAFELSASDMVTNVTTAVPHIEKLVTALAYVLGMAMILRGIMELKQYGQSRTMYSQEHTLKGPIVLITIGTMLLYLPTTIQTVMSTFWAVPCPYCYEMDTDSAKQIYTGCAMIVELIGVIAVVRGLMVLSQSAKHHGQGDTVSRGLTHIIAGALCVNFFQFLQTILITFGLIHN